MDSSFAKIKGTAGWYYNKWPGFLRMEAYQLMEAYSNGENIDSYVLRNMKSRVKKRKLETDHVLPDPVKRNDETAVAV